MEYLDNLDIVAIKGNYPRDPGHSYESELDVYGVHIFLTHGHKYKIRTSIKKLFQKGLSGGYQLVLYGHTHIPEANLINGVLLINPGSANMNRNFREPSYVVIMIKEDQEIQYEFRESHTNKVLDL